MVKIEKSEVIQKCIDGLRLNQQDLINKEVNTDFIKPVYVTNETGILKTFSRVVTTDTVDIVVPSNVQWEIISICVRYTATATVGNRTFRCSLLNGSLYFYNITSATNHTANQIWNYMLRPEVSVDIVTGITGNMCLSIPKIIPPSFTIRFFDGAAIDVADSMVVSIIYKEMSLTN